MIKLVKMDESGPAYKGGNFVMFGLMIDAADFVRTDSVLGEVFSSIASEYKLDDDEFKSKYIVDMNIEEKQKILTRICNKILSEEMTIFGVAISTKYHQEDKTLKKENDIPDLNYWTLCSIYNCAMVQKWIEREVNSSSCYAIMFSDYYKSIRRTAVVLHKNAPWFDGLYQRTQASLTDARRFDRIMDRTIFPEDSQNSPIVQAADAVCHIYRSYLDILDERLDKNYKYMDCEGRKSWEDDRKVYKSLVDILDKRREYIGTPPDTECVDYFRSIKSNNWEL